MIESVVLILSIGAISAAANRIQRHKWRQRREQARRTGYQAWRMVRLANNLNDNR